MANSYADWPARDGASFTFANRHTDQLILPWHATASALATTPVEARMAAWLGERSSLRGAPGCVGFGIADIPWSPSAWPSQRDFLVNSLTPLTQRQATWPASFPRYRLPSATMEDAVVDASAQFLTWVSGWDDDKRRACPPRRAAVGLAWCPARPYPDAWQDLAWEDIPIRQCGEHGMWCPTAEGEVAACVFCDAAGASGAGQGSA